MALNSNALAAFLAPDEREEAEEGALLVREAAKPFDPQSFLEGHLSPVLFGSALRHFGVDQLLEALGAYAPPPGLVAAKRGGEETHAAPGDDEVSGFVFKIQANMDPNHRDRVAFVRVSSGRFSRGMEVNHVRVGRPLTMSRTMQFLAQERIPIDEAYAGDILGVWDGGSLRIGDTLAERRSEERRVG